MTTPTSSSGETVERDVWVAAPPEAVFAFFTEPDKLVQWLGEQATLDAQPGGAYRIVISGHTASGVYTEVAPPRRIVFTWGWEGEDSPIPPGMSSVEVTLAPDGEGTRVHLRHSGMPSAAREAHEQGWSIYLPRLAQVAPRGDVSRTQADAQEDQA